MCRARPNVTLGTHRLRHQRGLVRVAYNRNIRPMFFSPSEAPNVVHALSRYKRITALCAALFFFLSKTFAVVLSHLVNLPTLLRTPSKQNRTFGEDLQSMMCADGLVLAQSTLKSLAGFHSSAVWVFGALSCKRTLQQLAKSRRHTMVCRKG